MLVLPQSDEFVAALFGSMLAGATPSVVAPARAFQDVATYDRHFVGILDSAKPRLVVTSRDNVASLQMTAARAARVCAFDELGAAPDPSLSAPDVESAEIALLQFTSGSSGQARGVRVPYSALEANVAAIRDWLEWSSDDTSAFWIPHYHDMGIIGGLFAPLASQCDLWLMSPAHFVRRPLEYLRCFGEHGARLTALPSFGLEFINRRVRPADLEGMDFSEVKGFIVGAELIPPATLERFCNLLEPFGLKRTALLPAYGLAEATLAVSGTRLGTRWTMRTAIDREQRVVSCGRPLSGMEVTIRDENGRTVPDGHVGEITIHGASLASGYHDSGPSESLTTFANGLLRSGDAGFRLEGEIFPTGRMGDSLRVRGHALFAELFEGELHQLGHSREHNAVILGVRDGEPTVVWIAERLGDVDPDAAMRSLSRLAEGVPVRLIQARRGAIPRTSSGKPRRRALWSDFVNNLISVV